MHHFRLSVMNMQKINLSKGFGVEKLSGGGAEGMHLIWCKEADFSLTCPLEHINVHILPSSLSLGPPSLSCYLALYPSQLSLTRFLFFSLFHSPAPFISESHRAVSVWGCEKPMERGSDRRCKWSWKHTAKYETTRLQPSKS